MNRETRNLADVLGALQWRAGLLATQLRDGTATTGEQRKVADELEELADLIRSHADDVDAGIVAGPTG